MRSTLVSVSLLALCAVPGLAATPKPAAPSPARRLPAPEDVPPRSRQVMKARTGQHATTMQNLVRAVVLLDRPTIKVLADRIAGEKTFDAGALSSEDVHLPSRVSADGDALAAAARELAFAAGTGHNDDVLADRFAVLTHTCVTCHSGYVHGRLPRPPIDFEPAQPNGEILE